MSPHVGVDRLEDCVNVILSYQNAGGGWATYENSILGEIINPAETFRNIMIDYPYVECSSASPRAFLRYPKHRVADIEAAMRRGREFLLSIQRADGRVRQLGHLLHVRHVVRRQGTHRDGFHLRPCPALRRAIAFLLSKQMRCGGWGRLLVQTKKYVQLEEANLTSSTPRGRRWRWPRGKQTGTRPLHKAARSLMRMQSGDGDWPQQPSWECSITIARSRPTTVTSSPSGRWRCQGRARRDPLAQERRRRNDADTRGGEKEKSGSGDGGAVEESASEGGMRRDRQERGWR